MNNLNLTTDSELTSRKEFLKDLQVYEKRYRRLFESAKDGIIILNADDGMIVDVNPFLISMLGYSKENFLTKHIWEIGTRGNINFSKQLFKELQDTGYVRYEDLPLEASDRKLIHVEFVSNVYLVDGEKVIQCNIRDITARIKHEQLLEDEVSRKDALAKEMQHRIKNTFNTITSLIHLRTISAYSEESKNILEDLTMRVRSISDLYSLLYETQSFYEVDLNVYCEKVISSMLRLSNNITLNKNLEHITVSSTNAATIGMIIVELFSNIIKYAFPGSQKGIINVELKNINSQIVLNIEDEGIGMPIDFELYSIKSVGLNLVSMMIYGLDGKIHFVPGKGAKIIIEIPYKTLK